MLKLNIGCGRDYKQGWVNTDVSRDCRADVYFDIRKDVIKKEVIGIKMGCVVQDGEVEEIYISGVLEQILESEHLIHAMNECHRVLKPGGIMTVVVPNARYAIAHQDPMDVRKFTPETFPYFHITAQQYRLYGSIYGFKGWSSFRIEENARHIMTITMTK